MLGEPRASDLAHLFVRILRQCEHCTEALCLSSFPVFLKEAFATDSVLLPGGFWWRHPFGRLVVITDF